VVFFLSASVAACADPPPDSTHAPSQVVATAARDGVVVTLSVDSIVVAGDRTGATVTVENTSPVQRAWQGGGCDEVASLTIDTAAAVTPEPGRRWAGAAGQFKDLAHATPGPSEFGAFLDDRFQGQAFVACPADLRVNQLAPGQRVEMAATWNGEVNGVPAAAGPSTIRAAFPYLGPRPNLNAGIPTPEPIEVAIAADVVDRGIRLLSPGLAIDAALASEPFAAWLVKAGPIQGWDGVDLQAAGHTFVVILIVGGVAGRASVDRVTGAVAFDTRPR
jgi:hypothetical protein